jgi:hypothetical protein
LIALTTTSPMAICETPLGCVIDFTWTCLLFLP